MLEKNFHEIVSGRRKGITATALRGGLWLAQGPYRIAVGVRNWRFDHSSDAVTRVGVPVVSVGNLTVGGTGKTPMVKWIARQFRQQGVRVALLSRGYGAEEGAKNDEALELEQSLPDVPHLQNPDRVASARIAIEELESQAIVLDDGFQHRRLARDLDIVLLDATNPFGLDHLLPRGLLREPVASLRRADVVCLTRADMVDQPAREALRRRVGMLAPDALWCEAAHRPHHLVNVSGVHQPLESLGGKRVSAFCGIGNPGAFHRTLESLGPQLTAWREFPDHHRYSRGDVDLITSDAVEAELSLCTHKDLVKLQVDALGATPLWAVEIEMQLLRGEQELRQKIDQIARLAGQSSARG